MVLVGLIGGRCGRWYVVGALVGVVGGMRFYTTPFIEQEPRLTSTKIVSCHTWAFTVLQI